MIDSQGRHISYIRASVTDRCNFRCAYCAGGHAPPRLPRHEMLTFEEIIEVIRAATELGVAKVRITGGEPLIRSNVHELVTSLRRLEKLEQISMTTNGSRLSSFMPYAGILDSINVSLDTLNPEKFSQLTGGGTFRDVWDPVVKLASEGITRVRLNVVLLKNVNLEEVAGFAKLTCRFPLDVRFIEFMPRGPWDQRDTDEFYVPISLAIERVLRMGAVEVAHAPDKHPGPATYHSLPGSLGRIGFISAVSSPFCDRCNRIRLTADGRLKACLLSESHVNVKEILREPHTEDRILDAIRAAIAMKPAEHPGERNHDMVAIGG